MPLFVFFDAQGFLSDEIAPLSINWNTGKTDNVGFRGLFMVSDRFTKF
jgi:hypothetical protein